MQLATELDLLQKELELPKDKFNRILPTLCSNFLRKHKTNPSPNLDQLRDDVKEIGSYVELYTQYMYETIGKYQSLGRLEQLVRGIVETQASLLAYFSDLMAEALRERGAHEAKLDTMTNRVYQRCQNCSKPLKRAQLEGVKDELGLRFRDMHEYFLHDMDEISKLTEEASVLFRKKMLHVQGIAEELYMEKFQQMYENVSTTIDHVTASLNSITKFQERFAQLHDYQANANKNQGKAFQEKFDSKRYTIGFAKHFNTKICNLEAKINRIKSFFTVVVTRDTQTDNTFHDCTPQKIEQLKKEIAILEADKKQAQIYSTIVEKQIKQDKQKYKGLEASFSILKADKDKVDDRVRGLEFELESMRDHKRLMEKTLMDRDEAERRSNETSHATLNALKVPKANEDARKDQIRSTKKIKTKKLIETEPEESRQKQRQRQREEIKMTTGKKLSKYSNSNTRKDLESLDQKENAKVQGNRNVSKTKLDQIPDPMEMAVPERKAKQFAQTMEGVGRLKKDSLLMVPIKELSQTSKREKRDYKQDSFASFEKTRTLQADQNSSDPQLSSKEHYFFKSKELGISTEVQIKILPTGPRLSTEKKESSNQLKHKIIQKVVTVMTDGTSKPEEIGHFREEQELESHSKSSSQPINKQLSLDRFKNKVGSVLQSVFLQKQEDNHLVEGGKIRKQNQFMKTKQKMKSLSKFTKSSQEQMKSTAKGSKYRNEQTKPPQLESTHSLLAIHRRRQQRSKINTENNYEEGISSMISHKNIRRSINIGQDLSSLKFAIQLQKLNFPAPQPLDQRSMLECLPLLRKAKDKDGREPVQASYGEELLALLEDNDAGQLTEKDVKMVYCSLEGAYEFGKAGLKHKKSQSCLLAQQDLMQPHEISYMKQVFTKLASLHLKNKKDYQKIKLFLLSPYDSVISQLTELNFIKTGHSSTAMRESLKRLIQFHRHCTTKGEICRHLKYLLAKIMKMECNGSLEEGMDGRG